MGDVLVLEDPYHDRVGTGGERTGSRRLDVHGPNIPVPHYDDALPTTGERDKMPNTVILSAARTPIGKLGGGLSTVDATELGGTAIQGCARAR